MSHLLKRTFIQPPVQAAPGGPVCAEFLVNTETNDKQYPNEFRQ